MAGVPGFVLVLSCIGVEAGAAVVGLLSSGAPTAISQRCPGWPCAGFKAPPPGTGELTTGLAGFIVTGCILVPPVSAVAVLTGD